MKQTLFIAVLALGSLNASAQKIEIGVNGGITPFVYAKKLLNRNVSTEEYKPGYYGSLRAALNAGKWQAGASADKFQTTYKAENASFKESTTHNCLSVQIFANRIIKLPKSYLYAGINAGVNFTKIKTENIYAGSVLTGIDCYTGWGGDPNYTYKGLNGGVQAGYTRQISKNFSANVEAGARIVDIRSKMFNAKSSYYTLLTFPVSLGLRYSL